MSAHEALEAALAAQVEVRVEEDRIRLKAVRHQRF